MMLRMTFWSAQAALIFLGAHFADAPDLQAQNAETVLSIVVGHPLDKASDAFKLRG